jgi:hypothetical protein
LGKKVDSQTDIENNVTTRTCAHTPQMSGASEQQSPNDTQAASQQQDAQFPQPTSRHDVPGGGGGGGDGDGDCDGGTPQTSL